MNPPAVSVLMSVYNGGPYLAEAIDSLLAQTFEDFELIVVDDGSTDASKSILAKYAGEPRIRVLTNETNIGLTRSLNKALAEARGELIARQDADDRSLPARLEKQVTFLRERPNVVLLGTGSRVMDSAGRVLRRHQAYRARSPIGVRWQLLFGNPFIHSSVMFRRSVVAGRFGGYDESYPYNQDFELWSRVVVECDAANLGEPLLDYRLHAGSIAEQRGDAIVESRKKNLVKNLAVQRRNILAILGVQDIADEWPPLWTAINAEWITGPARKPSRALGFIERMYRRFIELHPEAKKNREITAQRAAALRIMARYFVRRDRIACATAVLELFQCRLATLFAARQSTVR